MLFSFIVIIMTTFGNRNSNNASRSHSLSSSSCISKLLMMMLTLTMMAASSSSFVEATVTATAEEVPTTTAAADSLTSTSTATNTDNATLPNIILLFMDDLGYGDVGYNGHPTTSTPNIDYLAYHGKILTSWYSGCNVCTGSRAALLTGRQFTRFGLPGVIGPTTNIGLPLNETTIAEQLHQVGYTTGIVGKWHLGQRQVYMPGNRGFDYYLGIPYSDDMGYGYKSTCDDSSSSSRSSSHSDVVDDNDNDNDDNEPSRSRRTAREIEISNFEQYMNDVIVAKNNGPNNKKYDWSEMYQSHGMLDANLAEATADRIDGTSTDDDDPAGIYLPLVMQKYNKTYVVEQPLDFTYLTEKYNEFALQFIESSFSSSSSSSRTDAKRDEKEQREGKQQKPFFLYLPFSHVHTTRENIPNKQYANCNFTDTTKRGIFGDALAESDWMVGNIMTKLRELNIENNTLILFTSDNGPWMAQGLSAGSEGLFTGRYSGFWNTGKGSTWEGGTSSWLPCGVILFS